ncbi:MAG: transcriptional regulator, LysR family-like protein, partial [Variovorax sp.]|nr:transcriptional regulator, LysR family-like protein [Variovorax sp.]
LGAAAPGVGALGLRTSMRNQWPCEVLRVESGQAVARVRLRLGPAGGGAVELVARVTRESAELLGLCPGLRALVLCKATAVKVAATGVVGRRAGARNRLEGTVARIARSESGDEVSLQLAPAVRLVGFAPPGMMGRLGSAAVATIAETALVVALVD